MVAEVVQNSAQLQLMHLALHARRVHSSRLALLSNMVTQVVRHTATVMTARLAKIVVDTKVVQSVHHMVTATHVRHMATVMTVHLAATVLLMVVMTVRHVVTMSVLLVLGVHAMIVRLVAETVQLMVVQVQQRVAATLVK
jgi:hypothetical protein